MPTGPGTDASLGADGTSEAPQPAKSAIFERRTGGFARSSPLSNTRRMLSRPAHQEQPVKAADRPSITDRVTSRTQPSATSHSINSSAFARRARATGHALYTRLRLRRHRQFTTVGERKAVGVFAPPQREPIALGDLPPTSRLQALRRLASRSRSAQASRPSSPPPESPHTQHAMSSESCRPGRVSEKPSSGPLL